MHNSYTLVLLGDNVGVFFFLVFFAKLPTVTLFGCHA